jgi:mono/diheme cytochrome c family protein
MAQGSVWGKLILAGMLTMATVFGVACQQQSVVEKPAAPAMDHAAMVKRGEYLVTVMGCQDCHTPLKMGANGPEPDMSRMLSGHPEGLKLPAPPKLFQDWAFAGSATNTAWAGPWGISYTANLTPDQNTGIGIWDEAMFIKAIRSGRHMGDGRPIQPPMPWPWFAKMTDEDLKAVFAYLKSIPPVANHVPDYQEPPGAKK